MPRPTIADLQAENEKLRSEVRDLRTRLESLASAVLSALDSANASVARHIRTMQMEHDEQHHGDDWS
jgi:hypothetical protein